MSSARGRGGADAHALRFQFFGHPLSNSLQTPGRIQVDREILARLPLEERVRVEREIAELERIYDADPLQRLRANCVEQDRYLASMTRTTAGFAGNQAGKTTALVGKALVQHAPADRLPKRLHRYKRFGWDRQQPVQGRIINPGAKLLKSGILPAFRQWTPRYMLRDGSFDRSWHSQDQILEFADPYGFIDFLTYEQELDKFGSVQRHYVGYDEPPPREIRDEGLARLMRFDGFEMFAMTPLKANTGWVRRELWRKRAAADITVCKWSIHDNKALSPAAVAYFLSQLPNDLWRRAREYGDFVDIGGLIYPGFEAEALLKRAVIASGLPVPVPDDPDGAYRVLRHRVSLLSDFVVAIDPGLRNCALVWIGFDRDNRGLVFHEELLQQQLPKDYARKIREVNGRWGIKASDVVHVVDPSYRQRSLASGENVESALAAEGIYCVPGNNNVEYGCMQVRQRYQHGMLEVSPACLGIRDEADEYAMEDREDGVFKEVNTSAFHRLDALRYGVCHRTWDPVLEEQEQSNELGWTPGEAPSFEYFQQLRDYGPMGFMS
jgi:phage terminase large subunit-like protein